MNDQVTRASKFRVVGQVTRRSPFPLYEQVKTEIREYIAREGIAIGAPLPPSRELSELLAVSKITVNRALDDLEREGIVYRMQGKGTFVRAVPRIEAHFSELRGFTETLQSAGLRTSARVLRVRTVTATPSLQAFFKQAPNDGHLYCEITRLRYAGDIPAVLNTSLVQKALGDWMVTQGLETASYYELFARYTGMPVTAEDHTISICRVNRAEAAALHVPAGSDHFLVYGRCYVGDGQPVEVSRSIFHRQYFQFHARAFSFVAASGATSADALSPPWRYNEP
jgi:GntR family transcriptional regulator